MSPIKEPCFFAPEVADVSPRARAISETDAPALRRYLDGPMQQKRDRGLVLEWDDYLTLFKNVRDETAIGEASVAYLASLNAAAAIRARLPAAHIVMMLRNPVDRLFSRYLDVRDSGEGATFAQWLDRRAVEDKTRLTPAGPIWPGRYAVHVQRFFASFPRAQVHVCLYDDYLRTPKVVLRGLLAFLDVDADCPIDMARRHNVTLAPRWPAVHARVKPLGRRLLGIAPRGVATRVRGWFLTPRGIAPSSEERARALDIYREDITTLQTLLDRDLSSWLTMF